MILEVSGMSVIMAPAEKETNNIIQKTGTIFGSKTSFHPILNKERLSRDFIALGNVSFILLSIIMEAKAKTDDI